MKEAESLYIYGEISETINIDVPLLLKQKRTLYKLIDDPKLSTKQKNHLVGILNVIDNIYDVLRPPK